MTEKNKYKSGYIAVIGKPNVGKSTIINYLLQEKLNIVAPKPQTTRDNILGILSTDTYQIIFIDTPGIHQPKTLLGKHMVKKAKESLQDTDLVLFILNSFGLTPEDQLVAKVLKGFTNPVILLINKIDLVSKDHLLPNLEEAQHLHKFKELIPISAKKGINMDILRNKIIDFIPYGPQYYDPSQLSDRNERYFVTEIIREQTLKYLHKEVPHAIAVKLEEMKDRTAALSYIKATIYIERPSQKIIIVGKKGQQLKQIGKESRIKLEKFLGRKVYLDLWVKVLKNWRKNKSALKMLGYE